MNICRCGGPSPSRSASPPNFHMTATLPACDGGLMALRRSSAKERVGVRASVPLLRTQIHLDLRDRVASPRGPRWITRFAGRTDAGVDGRAATQQCPPARDRLLDAHRDDPSVATPGLDPSWSRLNHGHRRIRRSRSSLTFELRDEPLGRPRPCLALVHGFVLSTTGSTSIWHMGRAVRCSITPDR